MSQSFSEHPPGPEPAPGLADQFERLLLWFDRLRDRPVLAAVAVGVTVLIAVSGWWFVQPSQARPVEELIPQVSSDVPTAAAADGRPVGAGSSMVPSPAENSPEPASIVVHVAGAVRRPGLVTLEPGGRVSDAITAAGGPTDQAEIHLLNLAALVSDGMQINVPRIGDVPLGPLIRGGEPSEGGPGGSINLNRATATELESLPGVGPATSAAIVEWRSTHGGFASVDDLLLVPGIGPAKLEALRDLVEV